MIFNHSLDVTQIAAIYNNQSPRFNSSGEQGFGNSTKFNFTSGYNDFKVVGDSKAYLNSSLNLSLGYYNGSWFYTNEQEFNGINTFIIDENSENITVNYTFHAGNYTYPSPPNPFYSPTLLSRDSEVIIYGGDTIAPVVNITFPINNTEEPDTGIDVNYTRGDPQLDSCWYSNDSYTVNVTLASCANLTTITWSSGQHNVTIWANDSSGNENSSRVTFNVSAASDTTNPVVNLLGPENGSNYTSLTINFAANYTDETALVNATPHVWNSSGNLINSSESVSVTGLLNSSNISIILPYDDTYEWNYLVCDTSNNCAFNLSNYTLTIDSTFPLIEFVAPTPADLTSSANASFIFNTSITELSLDEVIWNLNGTNYTLYNESLVLMYNFDNVTSLGETGVDVIDVSHNRDNATCLNMGSNCNFTGGKYGNSIYFDGSNDGISLGTNSSITGLQTNMTVSAWVKKEGTGYRTIYGTYGSTVGHKLWSLLRVDNTVVRWYASTASGGFQSTAGPTLDDEWHHVSVTVLDLNVTYYLDGDHHSSFIYAAMSTTPDLTVATYIGRDEVGDFFTGGIDELRVFNRTLTPAEIKLEYESNLRKYDLDKWSLYSNQALGVGEYNYSTYVSDFAGQSNITNRSLSVVLSLDVTNPDVLFVDPTPTNDTTSTNNSVIINTSITDEELNTVIWNWNGTNYTIFNDSLLLMYNFDNVTALNENGTDTPIDLSKYSDNGKCFGMGDSCNWTPSQTNYGNAIHFDGVDDYVDINNIAAATAAATWSFWFKPGDISGYQMMMTEVSGTYYEMRLNGGATECLWNLGSDVLTGSSVIAGNWYHWTCKAEDGGEMALYIDGIKRANKTTASFGTGVTEIDLGRRFGGGYSYHGHLDEVRIWNRSLSDEEVYIEYASNLRRYGVNNYSFYINQSQNVTDVLVNGSYLYSAFAKDLAGQSNITAMRTYTVGAAAAGNNAPTDPVISLNSTDHSNKTLTDLNCYANITDSDSDKMNVTVNWFENNTLNFTLEYNASYASGSLFIAALDNSNTTKGKAWNCGIRLHDGSDASAFVNSTSAINITILNSLPLAILDGPISGYQTTNRTPNFTFSGSDDDGDTLEYELNVSLVAASLCTDTKRYITKSTIGTNTNHDLANYLKCLWDNLDNYTWTVRAHDGEEYGEWNNSARYILINSDVTISLPIYEVNFVNLNNTQEDNTTDNDPQPLTLRNDGNALLNISVNFTNIWDSAPLPNETFRFRVRNVSGDCFNFGTSSTSWINAPRDTTPAIHQLNFTSGYQTACRNVSIDLAIRVPNDEPPGNKSSLITFTSSLGETY